MWNRAISLHQLFLLVVYLSCVIRAALDHDNSAIIRFSIEAARADGIGENPSRVAAFFCLKKDELVSAVRLASRYQVPIAVKNPLDKPIDHIFSRDLDQHRSYYLLDVSCPGAFDLLKEANSKDMFVGPIKWLLFQDSRIEVEKRSLNVYDLFKNLSVLPDSDVTIGQRLNASFVELISVYKPSSSSELVIENRGYWKDGKGFRVETPRVSSVRRKDLRGMQLKSCLVLTDPDSINHLTDYEDKHIDTIAKANYPWVLFLVEMMNATVTFSTVDSWGYRDSNNTWNGMIGMLDRKEIDLGGTPLFLTPDRIDVIQYVSLYTPTGVKFIFRRPPLSYVSNVFVLPFRPSVWLASGGFLLLVSGLLFLAWSWESYTVPTEEREKLLRAGNTVRVSWSDNILIIIGAVSQQGSTFEPRGVSSRIIFLMLFVTLLSLYTSYTANIVALLQSSTTSINSLDKLLESSLKFGVYDSVYNRHYFAVFQDPVRKAIYEQKVSPKGQKPAWMSMEEGVFKLKNGLFAFHAECGPTYKLVQETFREEEKCGFEEIDYLHVLDPILSIQKHSPYLEIIRVGVLKIREAGLQTPAMTRLYTKKPTCHGHTNFVSVGLIDSYSAFAILGWGISFSLIILICELSLGRRKFLCNRDDRFTPRRALFSQEENSPPSIASNKEFY